MGIIKFLAVSTTCAVLGAYGMSHHYKTHPEKAMHAVTMYYDAKKEAEQQLTEHDKKFLRASEQRLHSYVINALSPEERKAEAEKTYKKSLEGMKDIASTLTTASGYKNPNEISLQFVASGTQIYAQLTDTKHGKFYPIRELNQRVFCGNADDAIGNCIDFAKRKIEVYKRSFIDDVFGSSKDY